MKNNSINIENFKKIYFIGVGGIGMSALARWFNSSGKKVAGYDKTKTQLTEKLINEGISITFNDSIAAIHEEFKNDVLVVYTPAIPKDSAILNYYINQKAVLLKRSQLLGLITEDFLTVAVAGTHGKTTTSTMIAHLLHSAGEQCTAFLGGISTNLNSNLLIADDEMEQILVVEADEYDRSFLTLNPDIAVITSVEPDHLDIYQNSECVVESFKEFSRKIPTDGSLIVHVNFAHLFKANFTYSLHSGDYYSENIKIQNGNVCFDAKTPNGFIRNITLNQPGFHNIENALATIAVAQQLDISKKDILKAFGTYKGVKRRFEFIVKQNDFVYIDDYAHHPTEIKAFLSSVKELYPNKKLTVVFQPHLYSRTQDFAIEFAQSLSISDELLLLDIYPARELPIEGVSSEIILKNVTTKEKQIVSKNTLLDSIKIKKPELLVTIGAGDIDVFVEQIKKWKS